MLLHAFSSLGGYGELDRSLYLEVSHVEKTHVGTDVACPALTTSTTKR